MVMKAVKRVNPKSSHHKGKSFFLFGRYLFKTMDVHETYRGNHLTICVSQIIRLYALNCYMPVISQENWKKKKLLAEKIRK